MFLHDSWENMMDKRERRFNDWVYVLMLMSAAIHSLPPILVCLAAGLGLAMSLAYGFMIGTGIFAYRFTMTGYADQLRAGAEVHFPNWEDVLDEAEEIREMRKILKKSTRINRRMRWLKVKASIGLICRNEYIGRSEYLLSELELLTDAIDAIEARRPKSDEGGK